MCVFPQFCHNRFLEKADFVYSQIKTSFRIIKALCLQKKYFPFQGSQQENTNKATLAFLGGFFRFKLRIILKRT